ncbi:MAG: hypothetical protein K5854_03725 [Prevotella sp.]|jgi:hypothetical protein|nr:hypothetical protein [Prevotella sp.]
MKKVFVLLVVLCALSACKYQNRKIVGDNVDKQFIYDPDSLDSVAIAKREAKLAAIKAAQDSAMADSLK